MLRADRHATPLDHHPLLAIWELTQACDLACVHCRACAVADRDPLELSTAEGKRLLDSVFALGTRLMILTGGDPAKRDDLVELVRYGASIGLVMAVTPSGTALMTKELLGALAAAGMARLAVSIDGPDAATHDAFRRVDGSFDHCLRILEDACALGIERQVNTTLGPHNHHELKAMAALVHGTGSVLWSVFSVVPMGRADAALMLSADDLERALVELAEIAVSSPFDVKTTAAPHFRRILLEHRAKGHPLGVLQDVDEHGAVKGMRGVNDGVGMLFVSHRGEVFPSGFLPLSVGNVRLGSLAAMYRESPLFRALREVGPTEGKCAVCPFIRVCGGSRARAYAMEGRIDGSDPACAYVPKGFRVVQ
ncbi:TIGR04053 family radical SAM/SPASM domain-containing protein [soil metagenome]